MKDGFLDQIGCTNFTEGCPTNNYRSTDLYKYPACHRLNTKDRCFVADPSCNTFAMAETSTSALGGENDTFLNIGIIIWIVGPLLIFLGILIMTSFSGRRQKQKQEQKGGNEDGIYSEHSELLQGTETILSEKPSEDDRGYESDQIEFVEELLQNIPSNLQMKKDVESCKVDRTEEVEKTSIKEKIKKVTKDLDKLSTSPKNSNISNMVSQLLSNVKEDKDTIQEIENSLKYLKNEIDNLILKRDRDSASRAADYVEVYSGFAIFRTLRYSSNQVQISSNTICNSIEETNETDSKIIESITKSSFEKVVFLTLFHPTKLQYFPQFIRENGMELFRLDKEDNFSLKPFLIRSVKWPEWYMKMGWDKKGSGWGTKDAHDQACKFLFKPVEKREIDNIFYIVSFKYTGYYVVMKKGSFNSKICASVEGLPGPEGQWKIIRINNDKNPCYVMSPLSMPCFYIYMTNTPTGLVEGTEDLNEIEKKGIWHIIDADSES